MANCQTKQLQGRVGLPGLEALLHSLVAHTLKQNFTKVEVCCLGGSSYHGVHDAGREATSVVGIPFSHFKPSWSPASGKVVTAVRGRLFPLVNPF